MWSEIPPFESGYRYHASPILIYNTHPLYSQRPLYDARPSIGCTFHIMDTVCDKMETDSERKACRTGVVNAHTMGKGEYYKSSSKETDSAYRHGFYSTFSCPLQYNPYRF
jgi:hypothetical protein